MGVCCRAGGSGGRKRGKSPSRREALPRPLPQAGGEERDYPPAGRKVALPVGCLPAVRSSSLACGGGRAGICCHAGESSGRGLTKTHRIGRLSPAPSRKREGEEEGGPPARRKIALPVGRLPTSQSSSPLAGEAGWGSVAGVAKMAGASPIKDPSRREALPRPLPQAGGQKWAVLLSGGRLRFPSVACWRPLLFPRLRRRPGEGLLPGWRKRRARQSSVAPGGSPPTPPASGRGEKGPPSCQAEGCASSRSIAGSPILLPRLRGRPG